MTEIKAFNYEKTGKTATEPLQKTTTEALEMNL